MSTNNNKKLTDNHKCLLYWHDIGGGSLPLPNKRHLIIRGGYNAFDFEDLKFLIQNCKRELANGKLEFWGIKIDPTGEAKEVKTLADVTATELREILKQTTHRDTILLLGNPDVVGVKNQDFASNRIEELKNATGLEPEVVTPATQGISIDMTSQKE